MKDADSRKKGVFLGPEIGAYLRSRREAANLSQRQLAKQKNRTGFTFDHSWVSQWERLGPKEGFLKALAYLRTIDADIELIGNMSDASRYPLAEEVPSSSDEAIRRCYELTQDGKLSEALTLAVAALREFGHKDPLPSAYLLLSASIIARRNEFFALADNFSEHARSIAAENPVEPVLSAKILIESSAVAALRGNLGRAMSYLNSIPIDAMENDPLLKAQSFQTRGTLADLLDDPAAAIEHFEHALALYPREQTELVTPKLLAMIGHECAKLGELSVAEKRVRQAKQLAKRTDSAAVGLVVQHHAGRAETLCRRYDEALEDLMEAERLAERANRAAKLFEVRLALLELGHCMQNRALTRLLSHRLRRDRQAVSLPPHVARAYQAIISA